jgi:very-short-patch-repair endonuclease
MSQNYYNKHLKNFARNLRNDSTVSEIHLWTKVLQNKQTGYTFLRQRPIDNYIADFMCRPLRLIIELDGYSHNFKYENDLERDKKLSELGYKTLRFHDDEVMKDLLNVERTIHLEIEKRKTDLNLF